jgi:hypothetical protein
MTSWSGSNSSTPRSIRHNAIDRSRSLLPIRRVPDSTTRGHSSRPSTSCSSCRTIASRCHHRSVIFRCDSIHSIASGPNEPTACG